MSTKTGLKQGKKYTIVHEFSNFFLTVLPNERGNVQVKHDLLLRHLVVYCCLPGHYFTKVRIIYNLFSIFNTHYLIFYFNLNLFLSFYLFFTDFLLLRKLFFTVTKRQKI